jgi:PPM family protein phosphatase
MTQLALAPCAVTHPGLRRSHNEDAVLATRRLVAVADGVGGAAAGEVASRAAIDMLAHLEKCWLAEPLPRALGAAVADGNARIGFLAACRPQLAGMATTLTAVALDDGYVVANIGDSRTYLLRDGILHRLTRDDSFLQELLDAGTVDAAAARTHPQRNVVLAALDGDPGRTPAIARADARLGDRLLLCSDGLSDLVDDEAIAAGLAVPGREDAARWLLDAALAAGGRDNVTVVVADVVAGAPGWRREPTGAHPTDGERVERPPVGRP